MDRDTHHLGRKIIGKFFLIAALFLAAAILLGTLLYREKQAKIDIITTQISGLEYIRKLTPLLDSIRLHRYVTCIDGQNIDRNNVENTIAKHFDALLDYSDRYADTLLLEPKDLEKLGKEDLYPYNLKHDWKAIEAKPTSSEYAQMEAKVSDLIDTTVSNAKLMTLFDSNIAHLVDSALYELQNSKERLDKILLVLEKNEELKALYLLQKNNVEYIENNLKKCFSDSYSIRKNAEPALISWKEDMNTALHLINRNERLAFKKSYPQFLLSQEVFQKALFDEIEERLYCTRTELEQTVQKNFLITMLIAGMGITMALFLSKRISIPLANIIIIAEELKKGHLDARVRIPPASSGLKELALSINQMAEAIQEHIKHVDETGEQLKKIISDISAAASNSVTLLELQKRTSHEIEEAISLGAIQKKTFFGHLKKLEREISGTEKLMEEIKNRCINTSQEIKKIEGAESSLKQKMSTLYKKAEASQTISALIATVTSDINLVAMNASIEAEKESSSATLGLLTSNIRKLSDQVNGASEKIEQELNTLQDAIATSGTEFSLFHTATEESFTALTRMKELATLAEQSLRGLETIIFTVESANTTLSHTEAHLISKLEVMRDGYTKAHATVDQFLNCVDQLKQLAAATR